MKSTCCCVIWSKIAVRAAAGVMALTVMLLFANSLPSDFVSPMTPAFEALIGGGGGVALLAGDRGDIDDATVILREHMWHDARQQKNGHSD